MVIKSFALKRLASAVQIPLVARLFVLFALWLLEARAISVPFALHYIENKKIARD
jgi:hypothetical protein